MYNSRYPNIGSSCFGFGSFFDLVNEPNTEFDCLGVNPGCSKRGRVDKHIPATSIVFDEPEATIGIPYFRRARTHRITFPISSRARSGGTQ
jgi:hypothetical protein